MDPVALNKVFHDHECAYYDERFGIVHDESSAAAAEAEVTRLLGRGLAAGDTVLDVGSGTGWFAAGLQRARPDITVLGLDLSAGMLGRAHDAGATGLIQGDATCLPFADDSIPVVVGRGVLHHLPDPEAALVEWRRVVRPDGAVVLSSEPTPIVETHGAWLLKGLLALPGLRGGLSQEDEFWELAAMAANLHTFTEPELRELARTAGFTGIDLTTSGFAETLAMTASYATHGHNPDLAARVPWRAVTGAGARADSWVWDRVLPARWRHTLTGRLRP
ncbi:MAG: methyltransferase domain-containing protein [Candidatus Nanopelagicales bacterium]